MGPLNNEEVINPKTKNIRLYVKRVFISDDFDGELVSLLYRIERISSFICYYIFASAALVLLRYYALLFIVLQLQFFLPICLSIVPSLYYSCTADWIYELYYFNLADEAGK